MILLNRVKLSKEKMKINKSNYFFAYYLFLEL